MGRESLESMLEARLKQYRSHVKLLNRNGDLLSMEGWYKVYSDNPYYVRYLKSGSKLSFSRWLSKSERLQDIAVSQISKRVTAENLDLKISCRFNDLLRLADTPHFKSCLDPNKIGRDYLPLILRDPTAAIIYTPDKAGKFLGRAMFTLRMNRAYANPATIKILKVYGVLTHRTLVRFFERQFPQYSVDPISDDTVLYFAITGT